MVQEDVTQGQESDVIGNVFSGMNGKMIVQQVIHTLRTNEDAKKELYQMIKNEVGVDPEPYLQGFLGERKNKIVPIERREEPYREIAETVLDEYEEGYSAAQIAFANRLSSKAVANILANAEKYKKEIKAAAQRDIKQSLKWWQRPFASIVMKLVNYG